MTTTLLQSKHHSHRNTVYELASFAAAVTLKNISTLDGLKLFITTPLALTHEILTSWKLSVPPSLSLLNQDVKAFLAFTRALNIIKRVQDLCVPVAEGKKYWMDVGNGQSPQIRTLPLSETEKSLSRAIQVLICISNGADTVYYLNRISLVSIPDSYKKYISATHFIAIAVFTKLNFYQELSFFLRKKELNFSQRERVNSYLSLGNCTASLGISVLEACSLMGYNVSNLDQIKLINACALAVLSCIRYYREAFYREVRQDKEVVKELRKHRQISTEEVKN